MPCALTLVVEILPLLSLDVTIFILVPSHIIMERLQLSQTFQFILFFQPYK